jgi:hypothetical protein
MEITIFQKDVHQNAKDKGWYEEKITPLEMHMLCVTELAEASEEVRQGKPPIYVNYRGMQVEPDGSFVGDGSIGKDPELWLDAVNSQTMPKPEGELIELADCVIRILDYCESKGWNLADALRLKHAYNLTRSHKHGGKKL